MKNISMRAITIMLAVLAYGCGGNDSNPYQGRWIGVVFTTQANPTDITVDSQRKFTGTMSSLPVSGTIGTNVVLFSDGYNVQYRLEGNRMTGPKIDLVKQ